MRLYLLRHADAVPCGTSGYRNDAERPLTPEGHAQARAAAAALQRLKIPVDAIATSGFVRAVQTASPVARAFELERAMVELPALRPEAEPGDSSRALREFSDRGHVVLVGHEPHMSAWLAALVAGAGGLRCDFKKGAIACVELERVPPPAGGGILRWFLTPKQLALIGAAK